MLEFLDACRGRIGVMVELKAPYRYRRHDVVARTLRTRPPPKSRTVSMRCGPWR